ncbi:hypothetical protein BG011_001387 [Mortierella polycephala]|uniref:Enoyl reductase (ER) domain-containing protein n=1 Tax=Mortierella polycephala TaxID=41804 RepID=A0A9P6PKX5_9FUNG|nr:hypothetical protein BG011_001387 [Mortierella polycephala]
MSTAVTLKKTDANIALHDIKVVSLPRPVLKANQALLRIDAAALNHRELWILKNMYPGIKFDSVLGADAVGRITELNGESGHFKVGDRVVVMPSQGWTSSLRGPEVESEYFIRGGTESPGIFTQLFAADQAEIFKAPAYLTDIEAAALPLAGLTAYRTVFTKGQVVKGQNVLITGIGGGVALFALQYAVAVGANVYVTSSDDSKIERAIQLGAKGGANYRKENWEEQLLKASNGQQIDVVIDGASGPGADTILSKVLVLGGIFVTYGQTAGDFKFNIMHILRNIEVRGSTMGSRAEFEKMLEFVEKHQIRPIVSQVFEGLEKVSEAVECMKNGVQFGKMVVTVQH